MEEQPTEEQQTGEHAPVPDTFEWFKVDVAGDEMSIPSGEGRPASGRTYYYFVYYSAVISIILLVIQSWKYLFADSYIRVFGVNLSTLLDILTAAVAVFLLSTLLVHMLAQLAASPGHSRHLSLDRGAVRRLLRQTSTVIFFIGMVCIIRHIQHHSFGLRLLSRVFSVGLTIATSYFLIEIVCLWLKKHLVERGVQEKRETVDKTESILRILKFYAYGILEDETVDTGACSIDILSPPQPAMADGEPTAAPADRPGGLRQPAVSTAYDAIRLARDTFHRAAMGRPCLTPDSFLNIFPNVPMAREYNLYFNHNSNGDISKKHFRGAILSFYRSRVLLEQTVANRLGILSSVKRILYTVSGVVDLLFILAVLRTPLLILLLLVLFCSVVACPLACGLFSVALRTVLCLASSVSTVSVGDELLVKGQRLTVRRVGLLNTSLAAESGQLICYPNRCLWNESFVNMTKSDDNQLIFYAHVIGETAPVEICKMREWIGEYLLMRSHDYSDSLVIEEALSPQHIDWIKVAILLKIRGPKSKTRRLALRAEFTAFLNFLFEEKHIRAK